MMIELNFFGSARILVDGRPVTARLDKKEIALLAYLATHRGQVPREKAIELLWGGKNDALARQSLRQALANLKHVLPGAVDTSGHHFLELGRAVESACDVRQFEVLIRRGEHDAACALYYGPLLDGLALKDEEAFEEWLSQRRQYYEDLALASLTILINDAQRRGANIAQVAYARRMLAIDPLKERAYRALMLALSREGHFNAGLQTYRDCALVLQRELGVAPAAETTAVYGRLLLARDLPGPELPPDPTPFVGREQELAEATAQLLAPDARLLTVLGLGGTGKTRLALELARRLRRSFLHGVGYVALETPAHGFSEENLLLAIADSLHLFLTHGPALPQLIDYLRPREMLLVLDNCELFVPASRVLSNLLRAAPDLKIVATSRQRLDLAEEVVYPLAGMTYPPEPESPLMASQGLSSALAHSAPALLAQAIVRANPVFRVSDHLEAIVRVCQLVEGLPLALELVAPWTVSMTPAAVVDRLTTAITALVTSQRNFPERHRSLEAVFEQCWLLLTAAERSVLSQLAVIIGDIRPPEALAIARASPAILRSLARKSMLASASDGHYSLHNLVRVFALEKLTAAGGLQATQARHFGYFRAYVAARVPQLESATQLTALRELGGEFTNIRAAWLYGAQHAPAESLEALLDGMVKLCQARTWYTDGIEALQEGDGPLGLRGLNALRNRLSLALGLMHFYLGNYEMARRYAESGLRHAEEQADARSIADALYLAAAIDYDNNHYDEAESLLHKSAALYQRLEEPGATAECLMMLGNLAILRTYFSPAGKEPYRPPRAFVDEHLWPTPRRQEAARAATVHFQQALRLYEDANSLTGIASYWTGLGLAHFVLHDYEAAADAFSQAVHLQRQLGAAGDECHCLMWLAWVLRYQWKLDEARSCFHEALRVGWRGSATKRLLDCLQKYSLFLWVADREHLTPLMINAFVEAHLNTDERIRAEAINWRENISHYMRADQGPVAVDRAIALGRQQTLATLLYHLLGD